MRLRNVSFQQNQSHRQSIVPLVYPCPAPISFSIPGRPKSTVGGYLRWIDGSTDLSSVPPDTSTMPWFRPTESGLWLYKGEIGHCGNAPIDPSHTAHNILGQYDGPMSKRTARSMLSMRHIRRKCCAEDKEATEYLASYKECQPGPGHAQPSSKAHLSLRYFRVRLNYGRNPSPNAIGILFNWNFNDSIK